MHAWAVLELFEWVPAFGVVFHRVSQGGASLPALLALIQGIQNDVGLLVICAVVVADTWLLAGSNRLSERRRPERSARAQGPGNVTDRRWRSAGIALAFFVLLVAITFSLTGPTRIVVIASVFAVAAMASMVLLLLRVDASSRVLDEIVVTEQHLKSATEHLGEITAYAKRRASAT